jgi:hypothetical protein
MREETSMTATVWIIQTNVESDCRSVPAVRSACATLKLPVYEIHVTPGSPTLPPMPDVAGPVVLRGRTTLMLRAFESPVWRRGIFFDPDRFQHSAYLAAWGDNLMNADSQVISWGQLLAEHRSADQVLFLKPNDDLKAFSGQVIQFSQCSRLFEQLSHARRAIKLTDEIVVSTPKEVDGEWRLFFVGGEYVTGSMYRPSADPYVPPELIRFAERAVTQWQPAEVFVLDVARADQQWKIMECNCFNGSAFYAADVELLVKVVSEFQENAV